jgi:RES domain-containing protein
MDLFRASRRERSAFDPLDSSASIARDGWRFNDRRTEILYTAAVEALATLEVTARPGWHLVKEVTMATIEAIGRQFLDAVDRMAAMGQETCGVAVPSVISTTDMNVLLDPRQKARYRARAWARIPFDWLVATAS